MTEENTGFTSALTKMLGLSNDQIHGLIEKLDVDELTDLIDACIKNDATTAKKIIGAETEGKEKQEPKLSNHEQLAQRLFTRKDKAKQKKDTQNDKILKKSEKDIELGEDTGEFLTFGIGDTVAYDGYEATVKIPHGPGDTVGVMINGELKMVDKSDVHKLKEGVLGMTKMPGLAPNSDLKRIRELAGMRDEPDADPAAHIDMPDAPPMTPPGMEQPSSFDTGPEMTEVPGDMSDMGDMGAEPPVDLGDATDLGAVLPSPDAGMDALPALPAPEGIGSGLEDAAALDSAISQIEEMIPNVKISEFKTLVARLKALVSMAENAGKAALTESQAAGRAKKPVREGSLPFSMSADYKAKTKPKGFDGKQADVRKPSASNPLKDRMAAFVTNRKTAGMREDKINPKEEPKKTPRVVQPKSDDTRKTLMDYVREADDGMETIAMNRNDAIKSLQTRMGPSATSQQAGAAFDQMVSSGKLKQQNGAFMMAPMSDEDFNSNVKPPSGQAQPANGMSVNTANTDEQGQGTNQQGQQPSQQSNAQPGSSGRQPNQPNQPR